MLRILRIAGILFFALMIGVSANTLWTMNESGELFEKYNSRRKSNITIFGTSILAVGILGAFELSKARSRTPYQGFSRPQDDQDNRPAAATRTTDIYAAPEHSDEWGSRKVYSRPGYKHSIDLVVMWMALLRIFCFVLPTLYLVLLVAYMMQSDTIDPKYWVQVGVLGVMALVAFIAATGLCLQKTWGYTLGYVVAIINLLYFPYGTGLGLIVLVALVGAAPLFTVSDKDRRRAKRKKAAGKKKARAAS